MSGLYIEVGNLRSVPGPFISFEKDVLPALPVAGDSTDQNHLK